MKKTILLTVLLLAAFGIVQAQKLTLLTPNGGETLTSGTEIQITWSYANLSGNETMQIALEGTSDYGAIAYSKVSQGSYVWIAGKKMDGTFAKPAADYKIIIELVDEEIAYDLSDLPFIIAPPAAKIALMTPNGGEKLEKGTEYDINWSFAGKDGFVSLMLVKDDQPLGLIAENIPAASLRYHWPIGAKLLNNAAYLPGSSYRIQIQWQLQAGSAKAPSAALPARAPSKLETQANSDRSDGVFSIMGREKEPREPEEKKK